MGCCSSTTAAADPQQPAASSTRAPLVASSPLKFANKAAKPIGDENIALNKRVAFGIVYPEETNAASVWMYFNKEKPVEQMIIAATAHAGLKLDKGKLIGSPQRLNLFTLEGDVVRLDLEVEAHMGSTLHAGDVLVLEKGNRLDQSRLDAIRAGAR